MKKIKVYKVKEILEELDDAILNKKPFSLIRLGDGGVDFMRSVLTNNMERLLIILEKESIPHTKIYPIFYLFGKYCSQANFIDCPDIYHTKEFWPRFKRPKAVSITKDWRDTYNFDSVKVYNNEKFFLMKQWKDIYNDAEIYNNRYCNPEFNFLSLLKNINKKNLIDVIRNRTVYCIINFTETKSLLKTVCNVKIIKIVGAYKNLYKHNYKDVTKFIKKNANKCDLWFVGAGEIGRIFSGMIKQHGGRAIDIGSVFDCWSGRKIPKRLEKFIFRISENNLEFRLTENGKKYKEYI